MKKTVIILIMLLFTLGLFGENHWRKVGQPLRGERVWGPTLAFDSSGEMFVGFREQTYVENTNGSYYASVRRYDSISKTWLYVGEPKFSPRIAEWGCVSFAIDSKDELFFSLLPRKNDSFQTVMTYDNSSESWIYLSDNLPEDGRCATLSSDNDGVLHVVFLKRSEITVMKYNRESLHWEIIGNPGFANSASNEFPMSLVFDKDNRPLVAFGESENENDSFNLTVMAYNKELNVWEGVGKEGFVRFKPSLSMVVAGENDLFVAFTSENDTNVQVMQYDKTSLAWQVLPGSEFREQYDRVNLGIDNSDSLFISLLSYSDTKTKIMKYDFPTSSWDMIGEEIDTICDVPVFNDNNTPFVSCTDSDGILTVLTFDDQPDDPDTGDS